MPLHPLPSPCTEHAGAGRCGGMYPRESLEAPLELRRKVGLLGPIKTFCQKTTFGGVWSRAHDVLCGVFGESPEFRAFKKLFAMQQSVEELNEELHDIDRTLSLRCVVACFYFFKRCLYLKKIVFFFVCVKPGPRLRHLVQRLS